MDDYQGSSAESHLLPTPEKLNAWLLEKFREAAVWQECSHTCNPWENDREREVTVGKELLGSLGTLLGGSFSAVANFRNQGSEQSRD